MDEGFLEYLKNDQKSVATQSQYLSAINQFNKFIESKQLPLSIDSINLYIETFTIIGTKKKMTSIFRTYLTYLKSPILFELKDVKE